MNETMKSSINGKGLIFITLIAVAIPISNLFDVGPMRYSLAIACSLAIGWFLEGRALQKIAYVLCSFFSLLAIGYIAFLIGK